MSNFNQQRPYEEENYSISPEIIYYDDQKFVYIVIQEEEKPHYLICFGDNLQYQVFSAQSPFNASVELHKVSYYMFTI
ncbi:hypothetical protein C1646_771512 [Rhizophagus diaphanus]|nr:hypothetical protein C1646_771512 [Rhizophagus diaphanus] [Rhizophagus sp. MUCL 43196]